MLQMPSAKDPKQYIGPQLGIFSYKQFFLALAGTPKTMCFCIMWQIGCGAVILLHPVHLWGGPN